MIKSRNAEVVIKGEKLELKNDLICIVKGLIDGEILTLEEINQCIQVATNDDSRREQLFMNIMASIFSDVFGEGDK